MGSRLEQMAGEEAPSLDTSPHSALLSQAFTLAVERHQNGIHNVEAHMRASLKELEMLRGQEERRLEQRGAALQREYEKRMAALERKFLSDAEALQNQLREGLTQEAQRSQAALDSRARELLGVMGAAGVGAADTAAVGMGSLPADPRPRSARREASLPGKAGYPAPAVVAASEAIAALRMGLPASASPHQNSAQRSPAKADQAPRYSFAASPLASPTLQVPAMPTGMPNTAAAMRAALSQSHPLKPSPLKQQQQQQHRPGAVTFADGSPSGLPPPRHPAVAAPARGSRPAPPLAATGQEAGRHPERSSSSEFEDGSYFSEDSSGDMGQVNSRPPPVKTLNPGGSPRHSLMYATGSGFSRPGSGRAVHVNVVTGSAPGSPLLRAYSPCTCPTAAVASPGALRRGFGGGAGRTRHATYSSD